MAILKNKLKLNYTQIPNEIITSDLSDKSFRLLVYLYSKPNNWKIYQQAIANDLNVSRSTVNRAFKELQKEGYVEIIKTSMGGFFEYAYQIFLEPRSRKNTKSQKYEVAKIRSRKNATHNNTDSNKDLLNNKTDDDKAPTKKQIELAGNLGIEIEKQNRNKLSQQIEETLNNKKLNGNYVEPSFDIPNDCTTLSPEELERMLDEDNKNKKC